MNNLKNNHHLANHCGIRGIKRFRMCWDYLCFCFFSCDSIACCLLFLIDSHAGSQDGKDHVLASLINTYTLWVCQVIIIMNIINAGKMLSFNKVVTVEHGLFLLNQSLNICHVCFPRYCLYVYIFLNA